MSLYPKFKHTSGIHPLMSSVIKPRGMVEGKDESGSAVFRLLWTRDSNFDNRPGAVFQPNHFAPVIQCQSASRPPTLKGLVHDNAHVWVRTVADCFQTNRKRVRCMQVNLQNSNSMFATVVTKAWNDLKPPKTTSKNSTTTYNHLQLLANNLKPSKTRYKCLK